MLGFGVSLGSTSAFSVVVWFVGVSIICGRSLEHVRHLASNILRRQGYTILTAKNGIETLKLLREYLHPVHLLLTDVVMPEMNGKELYSQAINIKPTLKVVYMSGYTDNIIVHHGVLEKGVSFIQKPFSVDSLLRKVKEILDKDKNH